MFSRHILAVLLLFVLIALAESELHIGGRKASPEPRVLYDSTTLSQVSPSQSSASELISSLLASLSSDAASYISSEVTTSSVPSSLPTQLSSVTTAADTTTDSTATGSTSLVIPTSPTISLTTTLSPSSSAAIAPVSTSSSSTIDSRTQTIILAVCITVLGLAILIITSILFRRYRRHQSPFSPFSHRGASPIDDDEIATWRGNTQPMAETPSTHVRNASSIVFQPQSGWTWTVSSSPNSSSPATSPPPGSGEALPYPPPPPVAHAPNARSGLTDGAIPGAAPFIAPARRQSRRLSKAASAGHLRSKSHRSSASVSSIREPRTSTSNGQWTEPEDWAVQRKQSNSGRVAKTAIGRTSMGDDVRPGGLSPRPITAANVPTPEIPGSAY